MLEMQENHLDELLTDYLSAELDPQLGRIRAVVTRMSGDRSPSIPQPVRALRGWTLAVAGAALAASIAGLWAAPVFLPSHRPAHSTAGPVAQPVAESGDDDLPGVVRLVESRTVDEGTVVFDQKIPARKLRRRQVEQIEWYDPQEHVHIQATVPREDVTFVEMDTF